eukprot:405149-Pelagomonas_calceolata.AAC.5
MAMDLWHCATLAGFHNDYAPSAWNFVGVHLQISEIDYAPMAMDVWQPQRCKDAEMIVFGDGGGYVRLYEVRMNPAVSAHTTPMLIFFKFNVSHYVAGTRSPLGPHAPWVKSYT